MTYQTQNPIFNQLKEEHKFDPLQDVSYIRLRHQDGITTWRIARFGTTNKYYKGEPQT